MAPLYLLFCKPPTEPIEASRDTAVGVVTSGQLGADSTSVISLKPYQQQLEQAKGVETMLDQGLKNRMRAIEDVDSEN